MQRSYWYSLTFCLKLVYQCFDYSPLLFQGSLWNILLPHILEHSVPWPFIFTCYIAVFCSFFVICFDSSLGVKNWRSRLTCNSWVLLFPNSVSSPPHTHTHSETHFMEIRIWKSERMVFCFFNRTRSSNLSTKRYLVLGHNSSYRQK